MLLLKLQGGLGIRRNVETSGNPPLRLARSLRGANIAVQNYSATASFSMTTFRCVVTSLCSLMGTVNSPTVFKGSWI